MTVPLFIGFMLARLGIGLGMLYGGERAVNKDEIMLTRFFAGGLLLWTLLFTVPFLA